MGSDLDKRGIKNEIKGSVKEAEGKALKTIGNVTGNESEQRKGDAKELEGMVQKATGEAQREIAKER